MKKFLKKNKKILTMIGIAIVLFVIVFLVYKIFFGPSGSDRYEGMSSHELSKSEISEVKKVINDVDNVKNVKVYTNSKIIKIILTLKSDVEFDVVKDIANKTISKIDKKNLEYYDLEFFVQSSDDSKVYPRIGYKHKSSEKFVW